MRTSDHEPSLLAGLGGPAAVALVGVALLPLLALAIGVRPAAFAEVLASPSFGPAVALSAGTTLVTAVLLAGGGTPLAWWLARSGGSASRAVELLLRLPAVTPPAVAGVALLAAFGRRGLFGSTLGALGLDLPFTTAAVVLAQLFVALPFYVLPATAAFRRVSPELLLVARTLGAGPTRAFSTVALPLAAPGLRSALAVAWARALGEFGATLLFAGSLRGRTQTLPLAIYSALEDDLEAARALAVILLALAGTVFVMLGGRAPR